MRRIPNYKYKSFISIAEAEEKGLINAHTISDGIKHNTMVYLNESDNPDIDPPYISYADALSINDSLDNAQAYAMIGVKPSENNLITAFLDLAGEVDMLRTIIRNKINNNQIVVNDKEPVVAFHPHVSKEDIHNTYRRIRTSLGRIIEYTANAADAVNSNLANVMLYALKEKENYGHMEQYDKLEQSKEEAIEKETVTLDYSD